MSAGFGWSLGDVVLLAKFSRKIHKALKTHGGSKEQYHKAIITLKNLQETLNEVRCILNNPQPGFRTAVQLQLHESTSSIADFNARMDSKYAKALAGDSCGPITAIWKKADWAFNAVEELDEFWIQLSRRLETAKLLMVCDTHTATMSNHKTLLGIEPQLSEVQDLCSTTGSHLAKLTQNHHALGTEIDAQLKALQVQSRAAVELGTITQDTVADALGKIRKLSIESEQDHKTKFIPTERGLDLIQRLHGLITDFKEQKEGTTSRAVATQAYQSLLAEDYLDRLTRVAHDEAAMLQVKSQKQFTRRVLASLDGLGKDANKENVNPNNGQVAGGAGGAWGTSILTNSRVGNHRRALAEARKGFLEFVIAHWKADADAEADRP
ncbi:hypothetical protein MMC30_000306 [Trapelia coarctata]|nr:hypothetical protein [Trapelia coarctata]